MPESKTIEVPAKSYADEAVSLQMPLVRILKRQISWASMEDVIDAICRIQWTANNMDAEANIDTGEENKVA